MNFVTRKIFIDIIVSFTGKQATQATITKFLGFTRTIQFHGESVEIHTLDLVEETDVLSCPDCAFTLRLLKEYHRRETSNMENTKTGGNRSFLERDNHICVKQCMP